MSASNTTKKRRPDNNNNNNNDDEEVPPPTVKRLQTLAAKAVRDFCDQERERVRQQTIQNKPTKIKELTRKKEALEKELREVTYQLNDAKARHTCDIEEALEEHHNRIEADVLVHLTGVPGAPDGYCRSCDSYYRSNDNVPDCFRGSDCHLKREGCCVKCALPALQEFEACSGWDPSYFHILYRFHRNGHIAGMEKCSYPSPMGFVDCPMCQKRYCDLDFLDHFERCCRDHKINWPEDVPDCGDESD